MVNPLGFSGVPVIIRGVGRVGTVTDKESSKLTGQTLQSWHLAPRLGSLKTHRSSDHQGTEYKFYKSRRHCPVNWKRQRMNENFAKSIETLISKCNEPREYQSNIFLFVCCKRKSNTYDSRSRTLGSNRRRHGQQFGIKVSLCLATG